MISHFWTNCPEVMKGSDILKFGSSKEMLDELQNGIDFYNPVTEEYVFSYSEENNSICVYHLSNQQADELVKESNNEYWSTMLGSGGQIFENPETWCEEKYSLEGWTDTKDMLDREGKPKFSFESLKADLLSKKEKEANMPERAEKHVNRGGIER